MKYKVWISFIICFLLCSCNKEETSNFECNVSLTFDNVIIKNGEIYVTKVYPLEFEQIEFHFYDNKKYDIKVEYFIDSILYNRTVYPPFNAKFNLLKFDCGIHSLMIKIYINEINGDNTIISYNKEYKFVLIDEINDFEPGTWYNKFKIKK